MNINIVFKVKMRFGGRSNHWTSKMKHRPNENNSKDLVCGEKRELWYWRYSNKCDADKTNGIDCDSK